MLLPGLVSVTFRKLRPDEIVDLVVRAGLIGIEWGGDVHVPHGVIPVAKEVSSRTREAGLQTAAYGSYYRCGVSPEEGLAFETVLDTAIALNAPTIRVWAGNRGAAETDDAQAHRVVKDAQRIADQALAANITISFEYHGGTLTDDPESALRFYEMAAHPNIRAYWQPSIHEAHDARIDGLRRLLPSLTNLHVFQWLADRAGIQRQPLETGAAQWREYLSLSGSADGDRFALIEFVRDNSLEQFLQDAETLKRWLTRVR